MIENLSVRRALEFAITTEQLGQTFYRRLVEKYGDDAELKELFSQLARDEEHHEVQLRGIQSQLSDDETISEKDSDYLRAISAAEIFYGHNELLAAADGVETRDDALLLAHNLEKSTLLYYNAMKDVLGESKVLDAIIEMEKRHLTMVVKYMVSEGKMRGLSDHWA